MRKRSTLYFLGAVLITLLHSCSSLKDIESAVSEKLVIFPAPPDTTRIQYLGSISGSQHIRKGRSSFAEFTLGEEKAKAISKPYGVTMYDGKIFVCDPFISGLEIIDLKKHKFDYFIPTGKGALKRPYNCVVDEQGRLFIADGERGQIVVFDQNLDYLDSFGDPATSKPIDVTIKNGKIWICDITTKQVIVHDLATFKRLNSFPDSETGNSDYLYSPTNLSVTDDKVYVSDAGGFTVKIFDYEGNYLKSMGEYGTTLGNFMRPKGIATSNTGDIYVVDAGFENIQIFNNNSELLMFFGGEYKNKGDMWLPAKVAIDYDNLSYFERLVDPSFTMKYVIFVTNQYGPDKLSIYAFVEPSGFVEKPKEDNVKKKKKKRKKKEMVLF